MKWMKPHFTLNIQRNERNPFLSFPGLNHIGSLGWPRPIWNSLVATTASNKKNWVEQILDTGKGYASYHFFCYAYIFLQPNALQHFPHPPPGSLPYWHLNHLQVPRTWSRKQNFVLYLWKWVSAHAASAADQASQDGDVLRTGIDELECKKVR